MSIFSHFRAPVIAAVFGAITVCSFYSVHSSAQTAQPTPRKAFPVQTTPFDLELTDVGVVKEIVKSDTVRLESGKTYKLDNIRVPLQLDRDVISFLEKKLIGKKLGFYIVGSDPVARADSVGHILAHAVMQDGDWVQASMVAKGLAWVSGSAKSRDLVLPLYKHEDLARTQNLGLWKNPDLAVKNNDTIMGNTRNSFQVYEGTIVSLSTKGDYAFYNFDKNPKTDFTVIVNMKKTPPFFIDGRRTHVIPKFNGMRVRVRGWVEEKDGPMMELTYQEQIEFLDPVIGTISYAPRDSIDGT